MRFTSSEGCEKPLFNGVDRTHTNVPVCPSNGHGVGLQSRSEKHAKVSFVSYTYIHTLRMSNEEVIC